jgi:phospholipid/cholesterol/gamma-HCH transport system substrate-binding protein
MATHPENASRRPPIKLAGVVFLVLAALVAALVYAQWRGKLTPKTELTMVSDRAGLVMDPGSKVTYNGVEIGRVKTVSALTRDGKQMAQLNLEVQPRFVDLIPANVNAEIKATTVFGNKYVAFTSPKNPTKTRISSADVITASHVTTEFNTLFETLTSISEKVDPVKLNLTLSAVAEALNGLGTKFGQAVLNGNAVLDDINPQMPQIRSNIKQLANLADIYTKASPDFWNFLDNAVTTASTLNRQQGDLDAALLAATGFGNTGADVFEAGAPYFIAGQRDLVPTSRLLDTYSPELFCMIRNYATSKAKESAGGNGYSIDFHIMLTGAPNPYIYPDNLPRVNARGGPGGAPGCWQEITKNFWPAPFLVADYGASLAPYNHFELGQPLLTEYVWGRQIGENTINP